MLLWPLAPLRPCALAFFLSDFQPHRFSGRFRGLLYFNAGRAAADGDASGGVKVEGGLVLDGPPGGAEGGVDRLAGKVLGAGHEAGPGE